MTEAAMVKKITGETDDDLIELLLQMAEEKVLALTNRTRMINALKPAVREWAIIAYNRLGMQGESSRSEGGITSAFVEIPKEIQDAIRQYRLGRVSGHAYEKEPDEEVQPQEEAGNEGSGGEPGSDLPGGN